MIEFHLDGHSKVATYMQLVQQVRQSLRPGLIDPGDQLPRVREVAEALAINPNTVLKAYKELERDGLVAPRPGLGTFVVKSLAKPGMAESSALRRELARWVADAVAAGLERTDIEALVSLELEKTFIESDPSGKQGETS